ncbi:SLAM family member 6-like [Dendropsophus ebraccatus]|uniref:SLAM family member 6-like n=1 Tax=Dendropsophus ebraccatus TaxID=150705 RepID=UPI003831E5B4
MKWSFVTLLYVRCIWCANPCRETMVVHGAHGWNVTLEMSMENIDDITWIHKFNSITSTAPYKPINVSAPYTGKLASDQNASLVILNVRKEDEGTYDASVKLRTGDMCTQQYQLLVYQELSVDDIKISHNVYSHSPCHMTLTCKANGSDVTITWTSGDTRVTNKDVNVTDPKTKYTCTAVNPVSEAHKSITPSEYCETKKGRTYWILITILSLIIFVSIASCLYYWQRRRTQDTAEITQQP